MAWILENNTPRGIWPVGRVQKVTKGKDNVLRSCLFKTSKGDFVKPTIKPSLINDKATQRLSLLNGEQNFNNNLKH